MKIGRTEIDRYIVELSEGNNGALEKLYDATYKQLFALCYSYLKSQPDSEDALHDAYLTIKRHSKSFNGKNGFNWVYTITKNICLDALKRRKRTETVDFTDEKVSNAFSDEQSVNVGDESGVLALAREILNESEWQTVVLHIVQEMKFGEIARLIHVNENTVRWQYNNALKKIKKEYVRRENL